jgi:hypothetical protein
VPVRPRAASLAVAAALLTTGCDTVRDALDTADSARGTVEVCAEAGPKIVQAMQQTATAVANYRPGTAAEVERQVAEAFTTLHRDLEPLVANTSDRDVKAALGKVDTTASEWAANPNTFIEGGVDRLAQLNSALQGACGIG